MPDGGPCFAFLDLRCDPRRYPVTLMRAALKTMAEAKRLGLRTVTATASPSIDASHRFLTRLGFENTGLDLNGHVAFVWKAR